MTGGESLSPEVLLPYAGVGFAFLAALVWAIRNLCVRIGADRGDPIGVIFVTLVCNSLVVIPIAVVAHYPDFGLTPLSLASFLAAGVTGSLLARIFAFESIGSIGASRTAPVVASSTLIATALAVSFLGEALTSVHFLGIVLVVSGVAVVSVETAESAEPGSSDPAYETLVLPLLAAGCLGFEPVLIAIGLSEGTPILPGIAISVGAATIGYALYLGFESKLRSSVSIDRTLLAWYALAGVLGAIGLIAYFAALELAPVSIVIPVLQLSPCS